MLVRIACSLALLVAIATLASPRAAAATGDAIPTDEAPDDITSRILEEDRNLERRVVGLDRFRVAFPQRVSATVGAMLVRQPENYECITVCQFKGLIVQAEAGYSGGQLSAGYASVMGEKGHNEHFLSRVYLGYGVKGALMSTWNDADLSPSDQTLLGIEGEFTVIRINFGLGIFRHVGSGDVDDPWVVTGGIGWGF